MKNHDYKKQSGFRRFFAEIVKNLTSLFESSDRKEFMRLKNFIAS